MLAKVVADSTKRKWNVRWHGGGFTSQAVLDVLRRERACAFLNREGAVTPLPVATPPRVMVTFTNYASASDGDQFPYFFRKCRLRSQLFTPERQDGAVMGSDDSLAGRFEFAVVVLRASSPERKENCHTSAVKMPRARVSKRNWLWLNTADDRRAVL